ncbi:sensor histidine kinase [Thalassotalea marina]|uniref:histidine kinase n=1 Tax=Thalassotalea marina TaxID=1673741 RepID=A0A919BQL7_9GAMM|nr:HAMP domain-containing sensor histidine kinase [Thalassotalea marina]GHG06118.1 two-component sensor histidine kinase [Thalassotalea marina]
MKLSLYQRLSLSLLSVFVAILIVFFYWANSLEKQARYEAQQGLHLSLAENLVNDNPILKQGVYDYEALKNLFHTLMVLGPAFEFYLLDPTGKILTHSIDKHLIKRKQVSLAPLLNLIENNAALPIYGDDPKNELRQKVFSVAPVYNGESLQGYLYVIVAGEQYESAFATPQLNQQAKLSLMAFVGAILFLFIVMLGLFRYFTKPLRQLNSDIHALKAAGFAQDKVALAPWKRNTSNEVHQLGIVFEEMAKQISEQLNQLKLADVQRRELLADISHDLRTPLASLQGYVETVALGLDSLSPEQKDKYLQTALKNAKDLKSLIDQIFELAHLEGGQVSIQLESFNITELLYDVLAKFSLKCQAKGIEMSIVPSHSETLILGDIAKLERVLTNLIENAIRHTPAQGHIYLQVDEIKGNQCQVTVKDTGTGIKKEELSYIFDTRYRASNAVNAGEKHAGLGLAITKKLLELMHSEIAVSSDIGQGAAFSFALKKVSVN